MITTIATVVNAIARLGTRSHATCTCRADRSASGDLRHLREQGLIETTRVPGYRDHAASFTKDGRSLLESHRNHEHSQTFYAGWGASSTTS